MRHGHDQYLGGLGLPRPVAVGGNAGDREPAAARPPGGSREVAGAADGHDDVAVGGQLDDGARSTMRGRRGHGCAATPPVQPGRPATWPGPTFQSVDAACRLDGVEASVPAWSGQPDAMARPAAAALRATAPAELLELPVRRGHAVAQIAPRRAELTATAAPSPCTPCWACGAPRSASEPLQENRCAGLTSWPALWGLSSSSEAWAWCGSRPCASACRSWHP